MAEPVVIVGGGQAAYACAATLKRIDPDRPVTIVTDEAHPPYERPPLSKDYLTDPDAAPTWCMPEAAWAERGITLRLADRVEAIDRTAWTLRLASGKRLAYGQLVLATGGGARKLPIPGGDLALTLRTVEDADRVKSALARGGHLVAIGAGVIGLELAATARKLSLSVTVCDMADRLMPRAVPPQDADWLRTLHETHGVAFRLGKAPTAIVRHEDGYRIEFENGESLTCDIVVAGLGIQRRVGLACDADLPCKTGILVDEYGRTADPAIFAIGDVAELPGALCHESYHAAMDQGAALAKTLTGTETPLPRIARSWTSQFGHNFQLAGDWRTARHVLDEGDRSAGAFVSTCYDDDGRPVYALAVDTPRAMRGLLKAITSADPAPIPGDARPLTQTPKAKEPIS